MGGRPTRHHPHAPGTALLLDHVRLLRHAPRLAGTEGGRQKDPHERARYVQDMVHAEIAGAMGARFDPKYFIPYVQLHEFEALAFADVDVLVSVLAPLTTLPAETLIERLTAVLDEAKSPEAINDGYETCPSRCISGIVPAYQKRALGPIITGRIGIETLRTSVPTSAFGWRVWNILVTGKLEPRRDAGPPAPARPRFSPKRSRLSLTRSSCFPSGCSGSLTRRASSNWPNHSSRRNLKG